MAMKAHIKSVAYYLPEGVLTNEDLAEEFPEWSVEKIAAKTGIHRRHIADKTQFSSHLATEAARRLFERDGIDPQRIDYLILCTQTPDFYMPTTACIVHEQLGLSSKAGATDINLGCSGYIYALGLARGLIESSQARTVLVVTADTYSKFINPRDKAVRTIFGDGAAATLVEGVDSPDAGLTGITYGTNGGGGQHLIVPNGGLRSGAEIAPKSNVALRGLSLSGHDLFMDGPEIFNFTLEVVPVTIADILRSAELTEEDIDLFVFHQANAFMLEHLRKKLGVPSDRFFISLAEAGNTVSSTIPIALADAVEQGVLRPGMRVLLMGFGVGLSWGGLVATWS